MLSSTLVDTMSNHQTYRAFFCRIVHSIFTWQTCALVTTMTVQSSIAQPSASYAPPRVHTTSPHPLQPLPYLEGRRDHHDRAVFDWSTGCIISPFLSQCHASASSVHIFLLIKPPRHHDVLHSFSTNHTCFPHSYHILQHLLSTFQQPKLSPRNAKQTPTMSSTLKPSAISCHNCGRMN